MRRGRLVPAQALTRPIAPQTNAPDINLTKAATGSNTRPVYFPATFHAFQYGDIKITPTVVPTSKPKATFVHVGIVALRPHTKKSIFAASVSQASYSEGETRQRYGDEQRLDLTFATRNHARSFLQRMVRHPVGCGNEY